MNSFYYLVVVMAAAVSCWAMIFLLKKPFFSLACQSVKQLDLITDKTLSDDQKDVLILRNLGQLVIQLVLNVFLFSVSILSGFLLVYVFVNRFQVTPDYSSLYFYLSVSIGSVLPFLFLGNTKTDYSYWSQLLHTLVLDNYSLGHYLFKREKKNAQVIPNDEFMVITGLARAGTSALTHLIYDENHFHSISYANMPFLMAPRIWKKIYRPKNAKKKERTHQDKVLFSYTSIEALEEYFFKVKTNDEFIDKDKMNLHQISRDTYEDYLMYQQLFQQPNINTLYLAKNNNFLLKYKSLRRYNELFKIILVMREPLAHATSLMRQHHQFCQAQAEDPFILKYMDWLGHHEFGLHQKVFDFGNSWSLAHTDQSSVNYWLEVWVNYYTYVGTIIGDKNLLLVHYQDLLKSPAELKNKIADFLTIPLKTEAQEIYEPTYTATPPRDLDHALLDKATSIYSKLLESVPDLKN